MRDIEVIQIFETRNDSGINKVVGLINKLWFSGKKNNFCGLILINPLKYENVFRLYTVD